MTELTAGSLARFGFSNPQRSQAILAGELSPLVAAWGLEPWKAVADPDQSVLELARIAEASPALLAELADDEGSFSTLARLLGTSQALGDYLCRHPEQWVDMTTSPTDLTRDAMRRSLLESVGADPDAGRPVAAGHDMQILCDLRVAYRRLITRIAVRDVVNDDPLELIADWLAHSADAVLEAALAIARHEVGEQSQSVDFSIVAMGKCGAEELNYVSDVDVIFVVASGDGDDEQAVRVGTLLAKSLMHVCSASTPEGEIWEVDAGLRPEGKAGALVRTLSSHLGYYERWAQTWEFQALLKARPAAGDMELGDRYFQAVSAMVWEAAGREAFVEDVQNMRRRVEANISRKERAREIKLGPGGLRDVEFSVQLLQLVHGRSDARLRRRSTLQALDALATYGYIGRKDASELAEAYRFLRQLEHRTQMYRMQRTHLLPKKEKDLRRIARSLGITREPAKTLEEKWQRHATTARRLHEKIFYRPLLQAVASLDVGEARLSLEAAGDRLRALGFADPEAALGHIRALTQGVRRRAAIQRTLLPVMLGWFADAPDPDAGLLGFRNVSETLGGTPWYLRLLRDESVVAQRLATLLASNQYAADLVLKIPEAIAMLQHHDALQPQDGEALLKEALTLVDRYDTPVEGVNAVRTLRRRELFRISAGDSLQFLAPEQVAAGLSDVTSATMAGALHAAVQAITGRDESERGIRYLIMAMGRFGGAELGYASDADVLFVYEPLGSISEDQAAKQALAIAKEIRTLLGAGSKGSALEVDAGLRPEGRNGPLVRTFESYRAYYDRWSSPWEAQALLRATPACGDEGLAQRFVAMMDPLRYPKDGLSEPELIEMRRIKARIESERLPRGADPSLHTKLGPGGLADVEWTAQLLQMQHGHRLPDLRSTKTVDPIRAAAEHSLLDEEDASALISAWRIATRVRNATMLATGRASDQIPSDPRTLANVAYLLGYGEQHAQDVLEDYRRATRRCRKVVKRVFFAQ